MRAGTLFSGIGAPECAAPGIDWRWCAEIDGFASAVHKARFPGVPNLGDVNAIEPDAVEPVDLVVFGSPCQSFSVAGRRLGLDDPRGNLALVALRLVSLVRPRWLVFENVPGLLSSDGGRDFGAFLGLLGECGYGWAYAILDAQHFGVPQRRRRVFVVGHLGDWRSAAAVLFEPESLRGDPAPRRGAGEGVAPTIAPGTHPGGISGREAENGKLIALAFDPTARQPEWSINKPMKAHGPPAAQVGMSVRRLTPLECERLQGFPDHWTAISWRGKPAADGPRYRALGNSMAVPVLRWILGRTAQVEAL